MTHPTVYLFRQNLFESVVSEADSRTIQKRDSLNSDGWKPRKRPDIFSTASPMTHTPTIRFSEGTRVVLLRDAVSCSGQLIAQRGTVAVVMESAESRQSTIHRVRFPNGTEHTVHAGNLTSLVHFKDASTGQALDEQHTDLFDSVVFQCVIGSRAYGLESDDSDVDRRGFFLPPADRHWALKSVPEQITCDETQEQYWEIQKFITLALKANPNVLECLYSPIVEHTTPLVDDLLDMRSIFLSQLIYQTYNGYVMSQFKKMQAGLHKFGQAKPKHVMHLIRLLLSGIHVLRTGTLKVEVTVEKARLLAIRNGQMPWEESEVWRKQLHAEFDEAFKATPLPEQPDHEAANKFLIKARRFAANSVDT